MSRVDVVVPDLGTADEVSIVEVLVKPGDVIELETPLLTLESDKATMDVPASVAGTVAEVLVQAGGTTVAGARVGLACGFGMINFDRGLSTSAVLLARAD